MSVIGIVALLIVIAILLKRRKARQSQEDTSQKQQSVEPYDYIDESSMRKSTELSNNGYLTPVATPNDDNPGSVVTPCDEYEQLETDTRENIKLYENKNGEYTSIEEAVE